MPSDATKETHGAQRELCKQCVLGVAYGMEAKSLAQRIGQPEIVARDLLRMHRETYPKFWAWSDANVDRAMSLHPLMTVFGWPIRVGSNQPAVAAKLSLPGQRRRDAAAGCLLRHRAGHRGLRPDP